MKSGNLNFLEPCGPHQACNGTALPLPFYINELPKFSTDNSKIVLFTGKTSIIVTNRDPTHLKNWVIEILQDIHSWYSTNLSSLNIDKTQFIQFLTNTVP